MTSYDKMWAEFSEFIRTQKHWILNQFQIVMGYIQINRTDLAFEFIKRITSEIEGTSIFTQLSNPEVGVRACLIWWKMRENNISLFPIIDKNIQFSNVQQAFELLDKFMDNLSDKYYSLLTDKHITWKIVKENNSILSVLKIDEEISLPNLFAENDAFWEKVIVKGNSITYIIEE